jgi:hypothetical protein
MSIVFFASYKADYCSFTTAMAVYTASLSHSIVSCSSTHHPRPCHPHLPTPSRLFPSQVISIIGAYTADYCSFTIAIAEYIVSLSQSIVSCSIPHSPSPFHPRRTTHSRLFPNRVTSITVDIASLVYYRVHSHHFRISPSECYHSRASRCYITITSIIIIVNYIIIGIIISTLEILPLYFELFATLPHNSQYYNARDLLA